MSKSCFITWLWTWRSVKLDLPPNISNYFATSRLSCLYLLPVSILAICTITLLWLNCLCLSRRTVLNQCSMLNHIHGPDSIHYVFMTNHDVTASSLLGLSLCYPLPRSALSFTLRAGAAGTAYYRLQFHLLNILIYTHSKKLWENGK